MKLKFDFDMNDWMQFQKLYLVESKQYRWTKFLVMIIIPLFFVILIVIDILSGTFRVPMYLILAAAAVAWVVFYPKRMLKTTLKRIRKMLEKGDNTSLLGKHSFEFTNDNILYHDPSGEAVTSWSKVVRFVDTGNYYFLFITSISAYIIPKHKLNFTEDKLKQLDVLLKSKLRK